MFFYFPTKELKRAKKKYVRTKIKSIHRTSSEVLLSVIRKKKIPEKRKIYDAKKRRTTSSFKCQNLIAVQSSAYKKKEKRNPSTAVAILKRDISSRTTIFNIPRNLRTCFQFNKKKLFN